MARKQLEGSISYYYDSQSLLLLVSLSIGIPLVLSFSITNDIHMRFARFLRITSRTARPTVWHDVFSTMETHVIVHFQDGRRIQGWPLYYSDDPEKRYLVLYDPAWVKEDKFEYLNVEGILITPENKITFIEFLRE